MAGRSNLFHPPDPFSNAYADVDDQPGNASTPAARHAFRQQYGQVPVLSVTPATPPFESATVAPAARGEVSRGGSEGTAETSQHGYGQGSRSLFEQLQARPQQQLLGLSPYVNKWLAGIPLGHEQVGAGGTPGDAFRGYYDPSEHPPQTQAQGPHAATLLSDRDQDRRAQQYPAPQYPAPLHPYQQFPYQNQSHQAQPHQQYSHQHSHLWQPFQQHQASNINAHTLAPMTQQSLGQRPNLPPPSVTLGAFGSQPSSAPLPQGSLQPQVSHGSMQHINPPPIPQAYQGQPNLSSGHYPVPATFQSHGQSISPNHPLPHRDAPPPPASAEQSAPHHSSEPGRWLLYLVLRGIDGKNIVRVYNQKKSIFNRTPSLSSIRPFIDRWAELKYPSNFLKPLLQGVRPPYLPTGSFNLAARFKANMLVDDAARDAVKIVDDVLENAKSRSWRRDANMARSMSSYHDEGGDEATKGHRKEMARALLQSWWVELYEGPLLAMTVDDALILALDNEAPAPGG